MPSTARIMYGPTGGPPFWTVRVTDAKRDVSLNGKVIHALLASRGVTVNCMFSRMAVDPKNKVQFPHDVYLASINPTIALIVDKVHKGGPNKGQPMHAIRYVHDYRRLVELNDTGDIKKMVKTEPDILEKVFVLRAPKGRTKLGKKHGPKNIRYTTPKKRSNRIVLMKGALKRAVDAGFVSRAVAHQLREES